MSTKVSINYLKKTTPYIFCITIILFGIFFNKQSHAQLAVPVDAVPGGTLFYNTTQTMITSDNIAWNTSRIAAKEVGVGMYQGVPVTGVQVGAETQLSADGIALKIGKSIISTFTTSIVQWINSGFNGSPMFIEDPAKFFTGMADRVAGNFIEGTDLGFLCQPFKLDVLLALNLNYSYSFRDRIGCTITDIINNTEGAIDGVAADLKYLSAGNWLRMTQNPQNNIYGSHFMATIELESVLAFERESKQNELNQGGGFLSSRDCIQSDIETMECKEWGPIKTPGKVIEGQLSQALGTTVTELQIADEFDEIINALLNQAMQKIVTSAAGLAGN
jgi:hypothetical protein